MIELDTRGVDALSGDMVLLPALIHDQLLAEMVDQIPAHEFDLRFDEAPWLVQHDQIDELETVGAASAPLDSMIYRLAISAHGDGDDLMRYLMEQWRLAETELQLAKGRGADGGIVAGAVEENGPVVAAAPGGGGADLPGESEDDHTVGVGAQTVVAADVGRASPVSGQRRRGKAGGGGVDAAVGAQDSPAA